MKLFVLGLFTILFCVSVRAAVKVPDLATQKRLAERYDKAMASTRPDGPATFGSLIRSQCEIAESYWISCEFEFDPDLARSPGDNSVSIYTNVMRVEFSNLDDGFYADSTRKMEMSTKPKK